MAYSSEDETDISDSELEEYVDRCYEQLQRGNHQVRYNEELYRCPYCPGKKKLVYPYKDLLQHASDLSKGSQNKDIKHKGKHLGLLRFIKTDLNQAEELSSELAVLTIEQPLGSVSNDLFVWPWMGIVANADVGSVSKHKSDLMKRGIELMRVRPLPSGGYVIVEFKRDWSGFYNALKFEKEFEVDHHGKKDYGAANCLGDGLYGWLAREDEYKSENVLGEYLQKYGDLKTVGEVEAEEKRKTSLLIADLTKTIQELRMQIDE